MNNLSSYCGLTDSRMRASDTDLPVLLFITAKSGRRPASILCIEDPWIMLDGQFMHKVFPNGKFLLLVRDGQHVLSMSEIVNLEKDFKKWNESIITFNHHCEILGPKICLKIHYEDMQKNPEDWLKIISRFLNLEWKSDAVNRRILPKLNRAYLFGDTNTISGSRLPKSYQEQVEDTMTKLRT